MVAVSWRSLRKQVLSPSFLRTHVISPSKKLSLEEKAADFKAWRRGEDAEAYKRISEVVALDSRWNSLQLKGLRGQAKEFFCAAELLNSPKPTVSEKRLES